MRDPSSAQFRAVRVVDAGGKDALCGSINAKNGFGGYVGFKPFFAEIVPVGKGFVSVPYLANQVGYEYVGARCGGLPSDP